MVGRKQRAASWAQGRRVTPGIGRVRTGGHLFGGQRAATKELGWAFNDPGPARRLRGYQETPGQEELSGADTLGGEEPTTAEVHKPRASSCRRSEVGASQRPKVRVVRRSKA